MPDEPLIVVDGTPDQADGWGIYADGPRWVQVVAYSFQGRGVLEVPRDGLRLLGQALIDAADASSASTDTRGEAE